MSATSAAGSPGPAPTPGSTLRRIGPALALAWSAGPSMLVGLAAASLLGAAVPVAGAWLTKVVVDGLVGSTEPAGLWAPAAGLVAVGLVAGLVPHLIGYASAQCERGTGVIAQDRLYLAVERLRGLQRLEQPAFQDRLRLAQQSAGVTTSVVVGDLLASAAGALTIAGFVVSLLVISPVMAGAAVAAAVPVLLAELALARRVAALAWGLGPAERRELFYTGLLGSPEAAQEIRLFGSGAFLRGRMRRERLAINAARRAQDRREVAVQSVLAVLAAAVAGIGLVWAVRGAVRGDLTVGDLTVFVAALAGVQGGLAAVAGTVARAHQQLLLFGHYLDVLATPPDLPVPARPRPVPTLRRGIELRDVWFRYADDHPWVLRGVDLEIPHGRTVALVGRNGAGKSTVVKLLCRLYDPTRGQVRWDGVDLREMDPDELRRHIGVVFQDFMHYDLSAADNVALGDVAAVADRPRIERAARLAGVHDVLAGLPRGYDTLLTRMFGPPAGGDAGDGVAGTGVPLSGGQWQRVAIARAFLRDTRDLMVLDEPSAGLDALAEQEVHEQVRSRRAGTTSVLVSHRMGTVRDADRIVVLSAGRIAEQGGHDELLARRGEYAALFEAQARGYRDELSQGVGA